MKPEELFKKLINNEISRAEFEKLLEGFDDDEIRSKYDKYLESLFEKEMSSHFEDLEGDHQKPAKDPEIKAQKGATQSEESSKKIRRYPVAAIILVFIGTLFSVLFAISWFVNDDASLLAHETASPDLITKSTPNRRMFRMRLEDGSFVHLNAVSKIIYPQIFDSKLREVEILGEVYFDVERDESKPFNIKVKGHSVEVLGTSFNIKAYDDDIDFSVAVESGKVRVDLKIEGIDPVILTKDQKLVYSAESKEVEVMSVDTEEELSWRKGILRFKSTPMAQVEKTLERWYGVDVVIEDEEIYDYNINGTHENKNIRSVIEALTYITKTKYLIRDDSIIIKN